MRYEVRHISLWATLRFGFLIGVLFAGLPALCIAVLAVQAVQRLADFFGQLDSVVIQLPTIQTGFVDIPLPPVNLDLVQTLGLVGTADQVSQLSAGAAALFLGVVVAVIVLGALLFSLPMLVFSLLYNMLAPLVGGFEVDLRERRRGRRLDPPSGGSPEPAPPTNERELLPPRQ